MVQSLAELEEDAAKAAAEAVAHEKRREALREYQNSKPLIARELQDLNENLTRLLDSNPVMTREAAKEFLLKFEHLRSEDQQVVVTYLDQVTKALVEFIAKYQNEMRLQAEHRGRETLTLNLLDVVLRSYL